MMVWSDMVEENLDTTGERLKLCGAAIEDAEVAEEEASESESGRVVKLEANRRGARRAMDMDVDGRRGRRTCGFEVEVC